MHNIKITRALRKDLYEFSEYDETMDETINRLLDSVEKDLASDEVIEGFTNINVSKDTMDRIKSFKKSSSDSYDKILSKAINLYNR